MTFISWCIIKAQSCIFLECCLQGWGHNRGKFLNAPWAFLRPMSAELWTCDAGVPESHAKSFHSSLQGQSHRVWISADMSICFISSMWWNMYPEPGLHHFQTGLWIAWVATNKDKVVYGWNLCENILLSHVFLTSCWTFLLNHLQANCLQAILRSVSLKGLQF